MDRDLALVERFSALKVPFWARLFPVLGTKAFITVFCSWFSDVSDKPFFWKFYRWKLHALTYCMWGTSLFFVMMPAVPTTIYFTTANQDGNYNVYLMALALGYFALNSLFQFAMLTCLPKLVLKAYLKKHAAAPRVAGADSLRAGGMYQFDAVLGNLRDNFLGLNAFTHFASDPVAIRNAWVADATDNRALYGASKNSYRVLVRLVERTFAADKARRRQTYAKRTGIEYVALVCLTFALLGRKDATRRIAAKSAVFTAAFLIFSAAWLLVCFLVVCPLVFNPAAVVDGFLADPSSLYARFMPALFQLSFWAMLAIILCANYAFLFGFGHLIGRAGAAFLGGTAP